MHLIKYDGDCEININDNMTYAYLLSETLHFYGLIDDIRHDLLNAINSIENAPFSKLELAEFLNVEKDCLEDIKGECYSFLLDIDTKQAKKWALENSYSCHEQIVLEKDAFSSDKIQNFVERLHAFSVYSDRVIFDCKSMHKKDISPKESLENLQVFLQTLCRCVNEAFFDLTGVRTHFRYLHKDYLHKGKKGHYLKLSAAHESYDYDYGMTPIPATGDGMIFYSALYRKPLICSLYKEFHVGRPIEGAQFKDYITFVLMDDKLKFQDKYILSMGISSEEPNKYLSLFHLLSLFRFDKVIATVIKSYAEAVEIDIVNTIVEHRDYIWQTFESVRDGVEITPESVSLTYEDSMELIVKERRKGFRRLKLEKALFRYPLSNPADWYLAPCENLNEYLNQITYEEMQAGGYQKITKPPKDIAELAIPLLELAV